MVDLNSFSQIDENDAEGLASEHSGSDLQTNQNSPASPFLTSNLNQLLDPLLILMDLDACEVYLRNKRNGVMQRVYHSGKLNQIWQIEKISDKNSFLTRAFQKNENRVINLPNRRFTDLAPDLQLLPYGQAAAYPIYIDLIPAGVFTITHSRRNLLNDNEQFLLGKISGWIAGIITHERSSQQQRMQIITEERERIGMDLHDGIIQSLYGIGLSMENARIGFEKGKKDTVKQIDASLQALQSAIADIRAYILDLRPRQLRRSNLFEGMQSLIREFRANTMVEVDLDGSAAEVADLEGEQIDALYHIFQEALSNTAKHAKATKVSVRLWRRENQLLLRILDNGKGIENSQPRRRTGYGLANMQARAEGVGGGIEIISIRNQSTQLTAWVPLETKS